MKHDLDTPTLRHSDTIFVIDDERELCLTLKKVLEAQGYEVGWATDPEAFLPKLPNNHFSCCLLDLKLGGLSGIDYLEKIHEADPHLPVIMITAHETVKTAVEAMKRGAFHYLPKPFDNDELKALIAKCVEMRHLYWELQDYKNKEAGGMNLELAMGNSIAIQTLSQQVRAVAATDVNVLLTGESGTGKELVAKYIHQISARKSAAFVPVDCASIPETLIESELFGHEKGAFTGAVAAQKGKLEIADGGTLLLDEVSNIPINVQAKLLRFLEAHTFERVGGRKTLSVSIRVIAATNRELPQLIKGGGFREDLFHRLNEFPVKVPNLRERPEDIPYLSLKFLHEFEPQVNKTISGMSDAALAALQSYPWPGNVRELRNVIKRAMVVATPPPVPPTTWAFSPGTGGGASGKIEKADLPPEVKDPGTAGIQTEMTIPVREDLPLLQASKEAAGFVEKKRIRDVLQRTEGYRKEAAQLLGIDEKTLYNKLKEYKIS